MGLYNTLQSLGFFAGGAMGGLLMRFGGAPLLFGTAALLCASCLWVSWRLPLASAQP
jgi:predicted MFS family arabinose efflux permease